jgi:hypothetical protein
MDESISLQIPALRTQGKPRHDNSTNDRNGPSAILLVFHLTSKCEFEFMETYVDIERGFYSKKELHVISFEWL